VQHVPAMVDLFGVENISKVFGILLTMAGISNIISLPLAGN